LSAQVTILQLLLQSHEARLFLNFARRGVAADAINTSLRGIRGDVRLFDVEVLTTVVSGGHPELHFPFK
jgi:hypothetical protein